MFFQKPEAVFIPIAQNDISTASMSLSFCQRKGHADMELRGYFQMWCVDWPDLATMTEEQYDELFPDDVEP